MTRSDRPKIVATGLGCVSPLGMSVPELWDALADGRNGTAEATLVDPDKLLARNVAEVKGFDPAQHIDRRQLALCDRFSALALVAAQEAVADAGLEFDEALKMRTGVVIGTGVGGMTSLDENFHRLYAQNQRVHPFIIPRLMVNAPASHISIRFGLTGPTFTTATACSSSNHAIGLALGMLRRGEIDVAITGGAEATITLGTLKGWEALRVMSPDVCRPFTADRKGMILGEGSGIIVLEREDRARARGAKIYAELAGFGMSSDAVDLVAPDGRGASRAISLALDDAGMAPEGVGYVNAHGTGTPANDPTETAAIRTAFGDHADRLMVSSTKSMHGHALGAAGAIEFMACVMALHRGVVPPTANFTSPDPKCDLDYVPNTAREVQIDGAVSNSFAFGGLNAVLALKRFG